MSKKSTPVPGNEFERLLKLAEYDIDYSEINGKLDDLTRLAAFVAGTPISLVNILEANTQWTVSNFGLDIQQTPRKDTVCQYVIMDDTPVEVEDMLDDERFKDKDYVTEAPNIRYYYGLPLTTPDGIRIGSICVMDTKKNDLSPEKEEFLKIIGNEVITRIEYEHKLKLMHDNMDELKEIQRKVSHDIRGPIGGIIGLAEILKDQAEEQKLDEFMQLLELINKGGRSVLDLADEILSNYSDSALKKRVPDHLLTLNSLKTKIDDLYQPQAQAKSIALSVHILSDQEDITFPKFKLMQIFGNLITNAIKFTPKNGKVDIELDLSKPPSQVLKFSITDNGKGMSEAKIAEILSDEAKSTAGTNNERGFGFGFQLARHLTEAMEGKLAIESKIGKGTSMMIKIPMR